MARDQLPAIYAENANHAAFSVDKAAGVDTMFNLVDESTVRVLMQENPQLLPNPTVNIPKDVRWNKQKLTSAITQGILQGESVPAISKRLQSVVGMNANSAVRAARTVTTGAENAGRVSSYERAKRRGIDLKQEWVAALDMRTRDSHRDLDGERVEVGQPLQSEHGPIRFPGDPQAHPAECYNCRCTLVAAVDGFETDDAERWSKLPEGMTYEEWKNGKAAQSGSINGMEQNEPLVHIGDNQGAFSVAPVVNTKSYHDAFEAMPLPKSVNESIYAQAGRILSATDGTENEHMVAISARTGDVVADNLSRKPRQRATGFSNDEVQAIRDYGEPVVLVHNHPASYQPSYRDIITAARDEQIAASVVIGHDGSVWYMAIDNPEIANELEKFYNLLKVQFGDYAELRAVEQVLKLNGVKQGLDWRRLR